MSQSEIMFILEADAWFLRNRSKLGAVDKVSEVIEGLGLKPQCVVEVGCSNGWRLVRLEKKYDCKAIGIEPGKQAYLEAKAKGLNVRRASAERFTLMSNWADLLIYGFCLYLTDPEDWLRIAFEGDRVLRAGGHLIIHDFAAPPGVFATKYKHRDGILSYHFDFAKLWEAHPLYCRVTSMAWGEERVTVLEKRPSKMIEVR